MGKLTMRSEKETMPVFIASPRSRSTVLMEMCGLHMIESGYISLGRDTEFFNNYTHVQTFKEEGEKHPMELLPLTGPRGMTVHYVYPSFFEDSYQLSRYKVAVLNQEKQRGREYIIKMMADTVIPEAIEFFSDRPFVLTKRDDIKGATLSLILARTIGHWHKRKKNSVLYDSLEETSLIVKDEVVYSALEEISDSRRIIYGVVDELERQNLSYHLYDYDDLETVEDMEAALNSIFGEREWEPYHNATLNISADYSKIFKNYDEIMEIIS